MPEPKSRRPFKETDHFEASLDNGYVSCVQLHYGTNLDPVSGGTS